jgi:hypothetical protein
MYLADEKMPTRTDSFQQRAFETHQKAIIFVTSCNLLISVRDMRNRNSLPAVTISMNPTSDAFLSSTKAYSNEGWKVDSASLQLAVVNPGYRYSIHVQLSSPLVNGLYSMKRSARAALVF